MRNGFKIVLALVVALVPVAAFASTFVAMSSSELVAGADAIVQGRVVAQESKWDGEGTIIVTNATVVVDAVLVGTAPDRVTVQIPGGEVNGYRVGAIGFPSFRRGEEVVLFLARRDDGSMRVVGHQLGHWEVVTRNDGVKVAVPRTEDGATFLTRDGRTAPEPVTQPLDVFKQNIDRLALETGRR